MNNTTSPALCEDGIVADGTNITNCSQLDVYYADYAETLNVERIVGIVVPTLFSLIFTVGLVGNVLVIIVVSCTPQMRNTTNVLIISLAISDLSFILVCVPFTATDYALPIWPFGNVWCKIVQYMINVCAYASVYTLVLMSLDRYLAVVHAVASMSIRTTKNSWIAVGILWFVILLINTPNLFINEWKEYPYHGETRSTCTHNFVDNYHVRIFFSCFTVLAYFVPLTLISVLYVRMLDRLWHGMAGGRMSRESLQSKKRVTRMVVVVVVIFALCWLPIQIIFVMTKIFDVGHSKTLLAFQIVGQCLAYTNSCVNPILYAFLSDNFRKGFKKVLCCGRQNMGRLRRGYTTDFDRTDTAGAISALTTVRNGKNEKFVNDDVV
ncbi:PREDICTED: allatostatin-A receptor-like [Priapulus caudatus]|uniref:Allatostatin-A receptor-like n=1 Tax=Priapulus caudatus TaxID=37621 RepID=A0ABM1F2D2_PRICU|nr:PREDICTED: allatostatin-A receptor-like [Priapulus caudatus]